MARLEHVIARNVKELRAENGGATQADLAGAMRSIGLNWSTNRVTQIETLNRPVSLIEVIGLAAVFSVPVSRLLAGDDEIDMPNHTTRPLAEMRQALTGEGAMCTPVRQMTVTPMPEPTHIAFAAAYRETRNQVGDLLAARDDLRKIAKRVEVSPEAVDTASYRVFGQSLFAERDERAGDLSDLPARSAQTKRGHITRGMVEELRAYFRDGGDDG